MRCKNDKKISNLSSPHSFFQAQNAPKIRAYDAPPDPLVGWGGGYSLPIPSPLNAFGVSDLRPPQHKILVTPVDKLQLIFIERTHITITPYISSLSVTFNTTLAQNRREGGQWRHVARENPMLKNFTGFWLTHYCNCY